MSCLPVSPSYSFSGRGASAVVLTGLGSTLVVAIRLLRSNLRHGHWMRSTLLSHCKLPAAVTKYTGPGPFPKRSSLRGTMFRGNRKLKETPLKLLIFDLDGTLIDSRLDLVNSVNAMLRHLQ